MDMVVDPAIAATKKVRTVGDPGLALVAQQMFSSVKQAQSAPNQGQMGAGLGDPSDRGPSHGKN